MFFGFFVILEYQLMIVFCTSTFMKVFCGLFFKFFLDYQILNAICTNFVQYIITIAQVYLFSLLLSKRHIIYLYLYCHCVGTLIHVGSHSLILHIWFVHKYTLTIYKIEHMFIQEFRQRAVQHLRRLSKKIYYQTQAEVIGADPGPDTIFNGATLIYKKK